MIGQDRSTKVSLISPRRRVTTMDSRVFNSNIIAVIWRVVSTLFPSMSYPADHERRCEQSWMVSMRSAPVGDEADEECRYNVPASSLLSTGAASFVSRSFSNGTFENGVSPPSLHPLHLCIDAGVDRELRTTKTSMSFLERSPMPIGQSLVGSKSDSLRTGSDQRLTTTSSTSFHRLLRA